jgi:hypothetical protein
MNKLKAVVVAAAVAVVVLNRYTPLLSALFVG